MPLKSGRVKAGLVESEWGQSHTDLLNFAHGEVRRSRRGQLQDGRARPPTTNRGNAGAVRHASPPCPPGAPPKISGVGRFARGGGQARGLIGRKGRDRPHHIG